MKKKNSNSKKKYETKKKKKKILNFLKDYSSVITIFVAFFAFIPNGIIKYYNNINSTEITTSYLSVYIDSDDWVKTYMDKNGKNSLYKGLISPTINNEIQKSLYKYPDKLRGYFVTYLVIEQTRENDALDVKINLRKTKSNKNITDGEISSLTLSNKNEKSVSKKISYPLSKNEYLKIPISVCEKDNYGMPANTKCYYIKYEPISIEYKNKYLFSKKNLKINKFISGDVIIDGSFVGGKGNTN